MREGWKEVEFGDVVEFPPKIRLKKNEMYPFIPMEDIEINVKYVRPKSKKIISGGGAKFAEGDTLFARITPSLENGKIAQAKGLNGKVGFGSTEYFVFRGKKNITDTDFVYYLSKTQWFIQNAVNSMVGASGRQRADAKFVKNTKIQLPPLPTQRKIAQILSAYDDLIENNLRRIALLEEQAQLTYEEWFVRLRFPGFEEVEIVEGLPVGWRKGTIKDLVGFQSGFAFKSNKFKDHGLPVIKIRNINNNTIDIDNVVYIDEEYAQEAEKFKLFPNDLLIAMTGATVGKIGYVPISEKNCFLNQRVGRFLPLRKVNNIPLVGCLMNSQYGSQQIMNYAQGAAQPNISGNQILSIESIIPSTNIQQLFYDSIQFNLKTINNLYYQNRLLQEGRDILLPRLMLGLVDVD